MTHIGYCTKQWVNSIFLSAYETVTEIYHMLTHRTNLNVFWELKFYRFDQCGIKGGTNYEKSNLKKGEDLPVFGN